MIGRNPGLEEDRAGRHFVGPLSTILHTALIPGAHLDKLATIYLTNVARCYHRDGDAPPRASFTACRPKLLTDIAYLATLHASPFNILCLGAEATSHLCTLLGLKSLSLAKALSLQSKLLNLPASKDAPGRQEHPLRLFFTYHPAYLARDHNVLPAIDDHLTLLRSALTGTLPSPSRPLLVPPFEPPHDS